MNQHSELLDEDESPDREASNAANRIPPDEFLDETWITLSQAARRLRPLRGAKPPNPSTLWRWATKGCRNGRGERVRLELCPEKGPKRTSMRAIWDFLTKINSHLT